MVFAGIIWGPAVKYHKEINEIFSKYSIPMFSIGLNLGDYYDQFVYDIYNEEDTPKWKIHKKVEHMKNSEDKKVKVIFFDIDTSKTFYHERKKYSVFANVEHMKEEVRNTYKDKIDDYFFDIIFHLTDNQKELDYTAEVLNRYLQLIEERDGTNNEVFKSLVQFYRSLGIPRISGVHTICETNNNLSTYDDCEPQLI